jgi:hypothetical protein
MMGHILETPYMYTLQDILKFTDDGGSAILKTFTSDEIENYIRKKISPGTNNQMPEIIKYHISSENKDVYVHKTRVFQLCNKLIKDHRGEIREDIIAHWTEVLRDFDNESAMKNNSDFELLVAELLNKRNAVLPAILNDKKTTVLHDEYLGTLSNANKVDTLFADGRLLTYQDMLLLRRDEILASAKLTLPMWYTNGFIIMIMRLLKGKHKKNVHKKHNKKQAEQNEPVTTPTASSAQLKKSAETFIASITGSTDGSSYLDNLADKWNQKLNKSAKTKLRTDVDAIIRDNVRYVVKTQGKTHISEKSLTDTAERLVAANASFRDISDKENLKSYIRLFIAKCIASGKY